MHPIGINHKIFIYDGNDEIPPHITHLVFADNYNQPIPDLPSNIISVTFEYTSRNV